MQRPNKYGTGKWYDIQNKAQGPTQIMIYDEIGNYGIRADDFVQDLRGLTGDIDLHLNTAGGSVFDGVTIYNALRSHAGKKTITVDGLAASIGSVIAMAGDEVNMAPGSQMMIHEGYTRAEGNADEMRKTADVLERTSNEIAGFYARKTGRPAADWRAAMKQETWYNAQEAVDAGLADYVIEAVSPMNKAPVAAESHQEQCCDKCGPDCACMTDHGMANLYDEFMNVKKHHGDVEYADPGYLDANGEQVSKSGKEGVARYPIDETHVQAAWSYINQEKNASQYTPEQLASIKSKIKAAMKKYGHEVADNQLITDIVNSMRKVFNL